MITYECINAYMLMLEREGLGIRDLQNDWKIVLVLFPSSSGL